MGRRVKTAREKRNLYVSTSMVNEATTRLCACWLCSARHLIWLLFGVFSPPSSLRACDCASQSTTPNLFVYRSGSYCSMFMVCIKANDAKKKASTRSARTSRTTGNASARASTILPATRDTGKFER